MRADDKVSTWELLKEFGFTPATGTLDLSWSLIFDFGNLKLTAIRGPDSSWQDSVAFFGILRTRNTMGIVEFAIPLEMDSREQCAAWIASGLGRVAGPEAFLPSREVSWLQMGREHQDLLPWVAEMTAYNARPRCTVERDWAKLALRTLAQHLAAANNLEPVVFGFDGAVLTVRCAGKVVALPAEGKAWQKSYGVPAEKLRHLPKRLMQAWVEVSVFKSVLHIGHWGYSGVQDVVGGMDANAED